MAQVYRKGNIVFILIIIVGIISWHFYKYHHYTYEGVRVYTNLRVDKQQRNITKEGYNLGKKWQCVEFVKRFYYEKLNHKMPNTYGHAISFYDTNVENRGINKDRNLLQIENNGQGIPKKYDILVLRTRTIYGHIAIVNKVFSNEYIEIIQQNTLYKKEKIKLNEKVIGWLRKIN